MNDADIPFATITEIGAMLRSGEVTSVALTERMLARIAVDNDRLNAFMTVTGDLARRQAARADEALKSGTDRGPLHGIPVAIKDIFATKGIRTTAGTKHFEDWIPDRDATAVARLEAAGAVCLGKTGMHELAFGATSVNPHFGAIANPWKPDHHPGGSSGGSAAAVAAGLAYAALGTDTGASVRQPAQCCGIVGFKPTFGVVGNAGVVPLVWTLDHVGPLTRSVRDAALVLQAIEGPDPDDRYAADRRIGDVLATLDAGIESATIGVPRPYFFDGGDAEVVGLVKAALQTFSDLGARVVGTELPDVEAAFEATRATFAEAGAAHAATAAENPAGFSAGVCKALKILAEKPAAEYAAAQHFRRRFVKRVGGFMAEFDVLVMPTSTVAAAPIAEQPADHSLERWKNCGIFNFTGQPAISVPCGFTAAGLPVGLMIVGRRFEDARVLQIANAFERATPWHRERPPQPVARPADG